MVSISTTFNRFCLQLSLYLECNAHRTLETVCLDMQDSRPCKNSQGDKSSNFILKGLIALYFNVINIAFLSDPSVTFQKWPICLTHTSYLLFFNIFIVYYHTMNLIGLVTLIIQRVYALIRAHFKGNLWGRMSLWRHRSQTLSMLVLIWCRCLEAFWYQWIA